VNTLRPVLTTVTYRKVPDLPDLVATNVVDDRRVAVKKADFLVRALHCTRLMAPELVRCPCCNGPLNEIDRFGERLVGCTECNRWTWPDSGECISLSLPQDDLISVRSHVKPIAATRL
jgi:hypothetical protein